MSKDHSQQNQTQSPPEIFYHYTSQQGLLGILEQKVLWATDLHYLNDPSEFIYPLNLANFEYRKMITEKKTYEIGDLFEIKGLSIYVFSFSEKGDKLEQWRGYCHNESGFSIGFDFAKVEKIANENGFTLEPCIYDPDKQTPKILSLIESMTINPDFASRNIPKRTNALISLMNSFWKLAPTIKHKAFKNEEEWRLISNIFSTINQEVFFRPGKSMIIPYLKFALGYDLPIREIIVGPTPHEELSKASVLSLMAQNKLKNVEVRNSQIPYRTW